MNVKGVPDNQRTAFVAAQHAGGERPRNLQLAHVAPIDLGELAVTGIGKVARLRRPVVGVAHVSRQVRISYRNTRTYGYEHCGQTQKHFFHGVLLVASVLKTSYSLGCKDNLFLDTRGESA